MLPEQEENIIVGDMLSDGILVVEFTAPLDDDEEEESTCVHIPMCLLLWLWTCPSCRLDKPTTGGYQRKRKNSYGTVVGFVASVCGDRVLSLSPV